jgi:hypothetical protein
MTFIDEHTGRFAVALLLRVLNIASSTYYAWKKQAEQPCDRDLVDLGLLSNIYEIWAISGFTYSADRVHGQLSREGIRVGRKRVERLMAAQGWQGAFLRRGWRGGSTVQDPKATPAPDLVNRNFTADRPNRLWVADATRIPCGEGVFWLAAVRGVFSRRIVGWKTSNRCDTDLILAALEYGIWSRDVRDGDLIHHSDRGSNGGFNWSSQHPDEKGCVDGTASGMDDDGDGAAGDAVAGQAAGPPRCGALVLGEDRGGVDRRGRRCRVRRVGTGRFAVVPGTRRHALDRPRSVVGRVSVVR